MYRANRYVFFCKILVLIFYVVFSPFVIFVIPMMCLVGIDSKIAEKTSFHFFSFWRFPFLSRSRGAIRWKTNVIFVIPMLCLVGIDIKIIKILIFFARTPTPRLLQLSLQQKFFTFISLILMSHLKFFYLTWWNETILSLFTMPRLDLHYFFFH